jgi:S-phase kinase-associated protein 1
MAQAGLEDAAATTTATAATDNNEEAGGLDDDLSEAKITLISGGDKPVKFDVTLTQAKLAQLIQTMITGDKTAKEFPCPQVPAHTLEQIVKYLEHHNGVKPEEIPCPVRSVNMAQIVNDPWDAEYIDAFEKKQIFEIILAANYLDIHPLLHLGCAKIATLIKQLDQKEINKIIEEEEKYRRENAQKDAGAKDDNADSQQDSKQDA